jgi:hypothetical protein
MVGEETMGWPEAGISIDPSTMPSERSWSPPVAGIGGPDSRAPTRSDCALTCHFADSNRAINGLTLAYNSGAVEGNVNRIKMVKRQMHGRAKFDLLRKRILLTT